MWIQTVKLIINRINHKSKSLSLYLFKSFNTFKMDGLQTIRKEVKKYIDKADEPTLKSVQALLVANEKGDWMNELPNDVIDEIDKALNDLDAGKGIPHAEIAKKYPQWFAK